MSDDSNQRRDFFGADFLALWRFAFSKKYPFLAIAEFTYGRSPEEADAAHDGKEAPSIRLVLDSIQAEALSRDFASLAERLRAGERTPPPN
jgi:hypothetical protein